ncbi:hypothetical protein IKP85_03435 [bacterium]|nr:hypothetical protein [bacterium]
MDPLASMSYLPTAATLPQITSNTDMMMMPLLQDYANQVSRLDDYTNVMSMNGSLFPAQNYNTGNAGSFDYDAYYTRMAENQARMSEFNMQQNIRSRQQNLMASAPMERISTSAQILQEKIAQNEQDQIPGALAAFYQSIRDAYDPDGTADEDTIKARAMNVYQQLTGRNLISDIRENGSSSVVQGFWNGALFGIFGQNRTAEDNIADITNQPKSTQAQTMETVGQSTGWIATGAGIGAGIGACFGGVGAGPGAVVGAIVGAGCALVDWLF